MSQDGDGADALLLARGDHARLLAKYEPIIIGRCVARLHGHADAEDVAQDAKLRLFRELQAGKTYPVPFRVVVHKVVGWTIDDYFAGRPTHVPLPDGWDAARPRLRRVRATRGRSTVFGSTSATLTIVAGRGLGSAGSSGAPASASRTNWIG